jgi:cell division septation protein DedD
VKLINYSLLLFISIFIFLSFVIEPVRFGENDQTNFSNDLPEINLNIALDDNVSAAESSDIAINNLQDDIRTSFSPAWTVKVGSYDDLNELESDLNELKKIGYKVYSLYDGEDKLNYSLFIGPTLKREDSVEIQKEISNLQRFNPEVLRYE